MTIGPELISARVLKRDASRTDYIVLPLVAGVLARVVLATPLEEFDEGDAEFWEESREEAVQLIESVAEGNAPAWETDYMFYWRTANFVLSAWDAFDLWLPAGAFDRMITPDASSSTAPFLPAALEWLDQHPDAPLTDMVFAAASGVHGMESRRNEHPFTSRAARGLRVRLAKRLRDNGLVTWQAIIRAALDEWTVDAVARHAFRLSQVACETLLLAGDVVDRSLQLAAENEAVVAPEMPLRLSSSEPRRESDDAETQAAQAAEALIETLRQQVTTLRRERDAHAHRDGRAQSRAASLTDSLREAQERIRNLEWQLAVVQRERDDLAEQVAVDQAFEAGTPDVTASALRDRSIALFTGQAAADARAAMAAAFHDLGTRDVACYWTDKARGPNRVPADTLVVLDVTFMSHADAEGVQAMAERSGAPVFVSRPGPSLIAREVATRLHARLRRSEEPEGRGEMSAHNR